MTKRDMLQAGIENVILPESQFHRREADMSAHQFRVNPAFLVAIVMGLTGVSSLFAEELSSEEECRQAIQLAMNALQEGNIREFIAAIENSTGEVNEEKRLRFDALTQKIHQEKIKLAARYGEPLGKVELLKTEKISDRFIRYTVLEYHERSAAVFRITYYRPRENWTFHFLNWTDDLNPLFEKAP